MTWNWKKIGTSILTLGISYLLDRYISKKVPPAVVGVIGDVLDGKTETVPKEVHEAIDRAIEAKVKLHLDAGLARAEAARGKK